MLEISGQHAHRIARAHGSFTSKLAAALEADKRSDEIMAKIQRVEKSARDQRQRVNRLDGKVGPDSWLLCSFISFPQCIQ